MRARQLIPALVCLYIGLTSARHVLAEGGAPVDASEQTAAGTDGDTSSLSPSRRELYKQLQDAIRNVYFNGIAPGWTSESYGCECNFEDTMRTFPDAESSAFLELMPWAAIVLDTDQPFPTRTLLNFYAKGSGLERMSFYMEDTLEGRISREVRLNGNYAELPEGFLNVDGEGGGEDGWQRIEFNLGVLTADLELTWNRLVMKDVSGSGFTLQLANMKLVQLPEGFSVSSAEDQELLDWVLVRPPPPSNLAPPFSGAGIAQTVPPPASAERVPILNLFTRPSKKSDFSAASSLPTKFVMKLKPNITKARLEEICDELGRSDSTSRFKGLCTQRNDTISAFAVAGTERTGELKWSFQGFSVNSLEDLEAMSLTLVESVEYFEQDMIATFDQAGASQASVFADVRSWGVDRIDQTSLPLDGIYQNGYLDGEGSHVYVLDTGVRLSHQDFRGRVGESASILGGSAYDDHGHGTHVAGTAVGEYHGVARKAIVHAVKVLGSNGSGSYSNIIDGLGWVKDHVQRNGYSQAVVVLSLGGPKARSLNEVVEDVIKNNIMVVVAAGNDRGGDACSYSPSSASNAITIGATTKNDGLASYSNLGSCLFMFAPGSGIVSASNLGDNAESTLSGTSMAAPHVAGVVAMILQERPGADVNTVKQVLDRAAPRIRFDSTSPDRMLNAESSRLFVSNSEPKPSPSPSPSPAPTPSPSPSPSPLPSPSPSPSPSNQFPDFGFPIKRPSWCDTCSWCMFC